MSPHAANSLVHDLVQMAQAMEQLPQVREELQQAQQRITLQADHVQNLELSIMNYKQEIERLHGSIRDLEVARDNAELNFLEAEDRTEKALAFVRTVFGNAGQLLQALEPVKPEPQPEPMKVDADRPLESSVPPVAAEGFIGSESLQPVGGESASPPIAASLETQPAASVWQPETAFSRSSTETGRWTAPGQEFGQVNAPLTEAPSVFSPSGSGESEHAPSEDSVTSQGQSESGPTVNTVSPISPAETVATGDAASTTAAPRPEGKYSGKRYYDWEYYVPLTQWLAGGGTEESYLWRPESNKAAS
jgi:hypothetical protein